MKIGILTRVKKKEVQAPISHDRSVTVNDDASNSEANRMSIVIVRIQNIQIYSQKGPRGAAAEDGQATITLRGAYC